MLIAQRDEAGDYVVRYNLPAEELPKIITRNVQVYVAEVERIYKLHGKRCVLCNSIYALIQDIAPHEVCPTCLELMRIFGPYVHRSIERERAERAHQLSEKLKKLHELREYDKYDTEDDEDEGWI